MDEFGYTEFIEQDNGKRNHIAENEDLSHGLWFYVSYEILLMRLICQFGQMEGDDIDDKEGESF